MFKASLRFWNFLMDVVGNTPKPPALPAAPHPDIYSIFLNFAWKWDKLWSNANSTRFCVFIKCRKSAPLKAFRDFCFFTAFRARHAPKASALPIAPHIRFCLQRYYIGTKGKSQGKYYGFPCLFNGRIRLI